MFKVTYVKCAAVYKLAASSKNVSEGVDPVFPNKWVSKKGFSLPGLFLLHRCTSLSFLGEDASALEISILTFVLHPRIYTVGGDWVFCSHLKQVVAFSLMRQLFLNPKTILKLKLYINKDCQGIYRNLIRI